ncbi:MAG: ACT domain-containing protein [Nocardioidaceae bacterium]
MRHHALLELTCGGQARPGQCGEHRSPSRAAVVTRPAGHVPVVTFTDPTVSVLLVGADQRGVTHRLFAAIAHLDIEVIDIEQLVLRGRLVLAALLTDPVDRAGFERGGALGGRRAVDGPRPRLRDRATTAPRRLGRIHVTVLGAPLLPSAMAGITACIAETGANIDRIVRMARYPVTAIDLDVSGADPDLLRITLSREAARQGVDIAVQPLGISRHGTTPRRHGRGLHADRG